MTQRVGLMKKFKFSELQANAILEMRLQKLAGLERKKIEDELERSAGDNRRTHRTFEERDEMMNLIKKEINELIEKVW